MTKKKGAWFKLKCLRGHKDTRPADECRGENNPECKECFMPMLLEEVVING